jgi:hypothetical protein
VLLTGKQRLPDACQVHLTYGTLLAGASITLIKNLCFFLLGILKVIYHLTQHLSTNNVAHQLVSMFVHVTAILHNVRPHVLSQFLSLCCQYNV